MSWDTRSPEESIIYVEWDGSMDVETLTQATNERIAFAESAGMGDYVVILDVRRAQITQINLRVSRWAAEVDKRMFFTIMVGKNRVVQVVVNMLAKFGAGSFAFTDTPENALALARAKLQEKAAAPRA